MPSPIAQSVALQASEQEVAGSTPRLGQYSFRGLMIIIATGFIPLTAVRCFDNHEAASGLERILCSVLVKEFQESMDRRTGRRYITEVLLETALNTIQSINQSINQ